MNKNLIRFIFGVGIFTAGVVFGKQIQKESHKKKTMYGGSIQIVPTDTLPEVYLTVTIPTEDLIKSTDVIFKVIKK